MRFSKALNYFGSIKAVAEAVQLNPSTVQAWKNRVLFLTNGNRLLTMRCVSRQIGKSKFSASRLIPSVLRMVP